MTPLFDRFRDDIKARLKEARDKTADATLGGLPSSFDAYRYNLGRIQALEDSIAAVDAAYLKLTGRSDE